MIRASATTVGSPSAASAPTGAAIAGGKGSSAVMNTAKKSDTTMAITTASTKITTITTEAMTAKNTAVVTKPVIATMVGDTATTKAITGTNTDTTATKLVNFSANKSPASRGAFCWAVLRRQ